MISKLIPIVIAATLSVGCFVQNRKMLIDYQFSGQENKLIDKAIYEWYEGTGSRDAIIYVFHDAGFTQNFTLRDWFRIDGIARMYKIKKSDPGYKELATGVPPFDESFVGCSHENTAIVLVEDYFYNPDYILYDDYFYSVLLHEIGHFYGLNHTEHGVMRADKESPTCIDQIAINRFCNLYSTCHNQHSTCEDGT